MDFKKWPITEEKEVGSLDEVVHFSFKQGFEQTLHGLTNPVDFQFHIIDKTGNSKGIVRTEFKVCSKDDKKVAKWSGINQVKDPSANISKYLHPLLIKFNEMQDLRAIYLEYRPNTNKKFLIRLYGDTSIEEAFRWGEPKKIDASGVYIPPYHIPKIQDVLNEEGFQFLGHRRLDSTLIVGDTPGATIFCLKKIMEDEVILMEGRTSLLATSPGYDRIKKERWSDFMDVYLK